MDVLSTFWDIDNVLVTVGEYPLSGIELVGTLTGLISVYLATKANVLTWPTGILNEIAFFVLFFQVQLYSDMLLQVFFLIATLYGWHYWKTDRPSHLIRWSTPASHLLISGILILGTMCLGLLMQQIHELLPNIFPLPAKYPFADAFTTVASILATVLLARKQMENWILWILIDLVSTVLYFHRGIWFISMEYIIFLVLATYGLITWRKKIGA